MPSHYFALSEETKAAEVTKAPEAKVGDAEKPWEFGDVLSAVSSTLDVVKQKFSSSVKSDTVKTITQLGFDHFSQSGEI